MRAFFVASSIIFLLVIFSGTVNGWEYPHWHAGSSMYAGCHHFRGKITCEDGSPILPTAIINVWEDDISAAGWRGEDDFITSYKVKPDGTYSIHACFDDDALIFFHAEYVEVYFEFRNACPGVGPTYTSWLMGGNFYHYVIPKYGRHAQIYFNYD